MQPLMFFFFSKISIFLSRLTSSLTFTSALCFVFLYGTVTTKLLVRKLLSRYIRTYKQRHNDHKLSLGKSFFYKKKEKKKEVFVKSFDRDL